jgi:hypothetical protein
VTLIAVWLRRNATLRELVIASDSRISGGESWDSCPKVIPLPRPATAIAMSGHATTAYSFLIHALNTCYMLDGHLVGRTDVRYLANELREVFDDNRKHVQDLPIGQRRPAIPDLAVALCGWSWRRSRFDVFTYRFNPTGGVAISSSQRIARQIGFSYLLIGDAALEGERRLKKLTRAKQAENLLPFPRRGKPFDPSEQERMYYSWEPLQVLHEMCDDDSVRTVGGTPQVTRLYQYGGTEQFVWRDDDGTYSFGGRPVLESERFDRRVLSINRDSPSFEVMLEYSPKSIVNEPDDLVQRGAARWTR